MDVYEARRLVIVRVIRDLFDDSQARFAAASGLSPSYVTRMLKEGDAPSRKRIGDDMAIRLEAVAALKLRPGDLLSPVVTGRTEQSSDTARAAPATSAPPAEPAKAAGSSLPAAIALIARHLKTADPMTRDMAAALLARLATSPGDAQSITQLLGKLIGTGAPTAAKTPYDIEAESGWPKHLVAPAEPPQPENVKPIRRKSSVPRLVTRFPFTTSQHDKVSKERPKQSTEQPADQKSTGSGKRKK